MKKVIRSKDLKILDLAALRELFVSESATALERTLCERELQRREDEADRTADIEDGIEGIEDEDEKLILRIRRTLSILVTEFSEGHTTAAKAAWDLSVLSGVPYLYTSAAFSVAVEMQHIEGVELRHGVAAAETRKGLIDADHLTVYKIVAQGSMDDIRAFVALPGNFVSTKRGGKPKAPEREKTLEEILAEVSHLL